MFTGIIESLGIVQNIQKKINSSIIQINPKNKTFLEDVKIGDSIAVNGVCLTVTKLSQYTFECDIIAETLNVSSLGCINNGTYVNLEKALLAHGRYGGHIVSGHIDGVGRISAIQKNDIAYIITLSVSQNISKYLILRGSICIDGISLTIMDYDDNSFKVSIIPHTYKATILNYKQIGDIVNLEVDIMSKYIEKLLICNQKSNITEEFLKENGF